MYVGRLCALSAGVVGETQKNTPYIVKIIYLQQLMMGVKRKEKMKPIQVVFTKEIKILRLTKVEEESEIVGKVLVIKTIL